MGHRHSNYYIFSLASHQKRECSLFHPIWMLGDEGFPRLGALAGEGLVTLIEVAQGSGQCVGGIEQGGHFLLVYTQRALQHHRHLLLAGGTVAGNGHFDLAGLIFGNGYLAVQGGNHRHTLGAAQLEHRLHVLAVERCLDGHLVGQVLLDDAAHTLIDVPEPQVVVLHAAQLQHAHDDEFGFLAVYAKQGITHDIGARVDADDDILVLLLHVPLRKGNEFLPGHKNNRPCGREIKQIII